MDQFLVIWIMYMYGNDIYVHVKSGNTYLSITVYDKANSNDMKPGFVKPKTSAACQHTSEKRELMSHTNGWKFNC